MCQNSFFRIFTFFIGLNLISLKWQNQPVICFASVCGSTLLAYAAHTVACCQRMRHYASKLLAQMAHTLAKSCKNEFLQAYAAHAVANCQRMRQHFASVCSTCGSNLLAQTAHMHTLAKLLAYATHTVALCQRRGRMRQLKQKGIHGERVEIVTASEMLVNSFPTWEAERTRIRIIL